MNVLVTGGGTVAPIDDVRQITNVSTGRFSAEITEACLRRTARVWHVHARSALLPYRRSALFDIDAPEPGAEHDRLDDLRRDWRAVRDRLTLVPLPAGDVADYAETLKRLLTTERIDLAFLVMAVSDYEPEPVAGKLESSAETLTIVTRRTPKVIRSVRDWAPGVFLVGFKLLSGVDPAALVRAAAAAGRANRADLTVANDLKTLRDGRHVVHLVDNEGRAETIGPEGSVADRLVARVFEAARSARR